MTYVYLIVGFIILTKGADILVDGSASIAKKFNISNLIIGLTIVALGSSAPEFFVNIISSLEGKSELAIGNIMGSIIINTLLILGISAMIRPMQAQNSTIKIEAPFLILGIFALLAVSYDTLLSGLAINTISRGEGVLLILFFIIFMVYLFTQAKNSPDENEEEIKILSTSKSILYIIIGLAALIIWGKLLVDSATTIAQNFGISEGLIGLTIVAIGTSLPELAISGIAAYKGNSDIAIGNVIGSNIYGVFLILGTSALIGNITIDAFIQEDILIAFATNLILAIFLMVYGWKWKVTRFEGLIMTLLYIAYMYYLLTTRI